MSNILFDGATKIHFTKINGDLQKNYPFNGKYKKIQKINLSTGNNLIEEFQMKTNQTFTSYFDNKKILLCCLRKRHPREAVRERLCVHLAPSACITRYSY